MADEVATRLPRFESRAVESIAMLLERLKNLTGQQYRCILTREDGTVVCDSTPD